MTKRSTVITISILSLLSFTVLPLNQAYATHNCTSGGSVNCHAILVASEPAYVVTYGVKYTLKVQDMYSSCSQSQKYFVLVTTWVAFNNGDWIEWGVKSGWIWDDYPTSGGCYEEWSYIAERISGIYKEYRVINADADVGSTYVYEISDLDKDKVWKYYRNGVYFAQTTVPYSYALGFDAGSESNNASDSISLPKTHIYNGQSYQGNNQWNPWIPDRFFEESPLWVVDCTSGVYADHIHVGSNSYTKDCKGVH
jgi:hypothetical protein